MEYYSTMEGDLRIKKSKVDNFSRAINEKRMNEPESGLVRHFLTDDMKVDQERYIEYADYYGKWYDDEEFARFVAPFVEKADLVFEGDDDERWGYHFNGRGKVSEIYWIMRHRRKTL